MSPMGTGVKKGVNLNCVMERKMRKENSRWKNYLCKASKGWKTME